MFETVKDEIEAIKNEKLSLKDAIFAYEKLEGEGFYRTQFMELSVIIWSSEDGIYINVPKLFESIKCDRKIYGWKRLESSKIYLEKTSKYTGIKTEDFFVTKNNMNNDLKGDYAHQKIICEILRWASVEYSIIMNEIIERIHVLDHMKQYKDTSIDNAYILLHKNELFDDLHKRYSSFKKNYQKIIDENILLKDEMKSKNMCGPKLIGHKELEFGEYTNDHIKEIEDPLDYDKKKSRFILELNTLNVIKCIFPENKILSNYRPDWLKNPYTKRNLEIDFYLPELKLAFEYDGIQHRIFTPRFHKTMECYDKQVLRDMYKNICLKRLNIKLIRIPDKYKSEKEIMEYLYRILKENNLLS